MDQDAMPSPRALKRTFGLMIVVAVTFLVGGVVGFGAARLFPGSSAEPATCDAEACDVRMDDGSSLEPVEADKVVARLFAAETRLIFRVIAPNAAVEEAYVKESEGAEAKFAVAEDAFWRKPGLQFVSAPESQTVSPQMMADVEFTAPATDETTLSSGP